MPNCSMHCFSTIKTLFTRIYGDDIRSCLSTRTLTGPADRRRPLRPHHRLLLQISSPLAVIIWNPCIPSRLFQPSLLPSRHTQSSFPLNPHPHSSLVKTLLHLLLKSTLIQFCLSVLPHSLLLPRCLLAIVLPKALLLKFLPLKIILISCPLAVLTLR